MEVAHCQVSIVEARNVEGDWLSKPKYYVKLRSKFTQAFTEVVTSSAPLFLKDVRLEFDPTDATSSVEVALLQSGDHGDLVIGKLTIAAQAIVNSDETPQWHNLLDPEGTQTGEIRLVIRHLDFSNRTEEDQPAEAQTKENRAIESGLDSKDGNRKAFRLPLWKSILSSLMALGVVARRVMPPVPGMIKSQIEDPGDVFPSLARAHDLQLFLQEKRGT